MGEASFGTFAQGFGERLPGEAVPGESLPGESLLAETVPREPLPEVPSHCFTVDTEPLNILIADSAAGARLALATMLRRLTVGARIHEAASGPAAQAILRGRTLDLIFIDRRLPQFDGRELLRLRGEKSPRSLLILMSDVLTPRWAAVATSISAYEVMLKPSNETHVESIINAFHCVTSPKRVLIVDKSRTARKIVSRMVQQSPFTFAIDDTDSGRLALMRVQGGAYHLVLIDTALSDGDGFETACRILEMSPSTKIVMMGTEDKRKLAEQCGVSYFLEKPFPPSGLDRALHGVFGLWRPYLLNARFGTSPAGETQAAEA